MSDTRTTARFVHDPPPTESEQIPAYLSDVFEGLSSLVNSPTRNYAPMNDSPPKPTDGDMAFANGSEEGWDPGGGRGMYVYDEGGWSKFAPTDSVGGTVPIGGIIMWRGSTAPEGWAICDGSNAPDGMSTPDLRNRFVLGMGTNGIDVTGGATVTSWTSLTEAQMPSHNHTIAHTHSYSGDTNETGDHAHGYGTGQAGAHDHGISQYLDTAGRHGAGGSLGNRYYPNDPPYPTATAAPNHTHSISTDGNHKHTISGNTGGSSASSSGNKGNGEAHNHEAEPPFYTLAYIMRYE